MQQVSNVTVSRDMWPFYSIMFHDHLEPTNAAPRTIETYSLAVAQLGEFLRQQGMPIAREQSGQKGNRSALEALAKEGPRI